MNPLLALTIASILAGVLTLLLWPDRGLLWRWLRAARASERVLTEDALKHLFDCEYQGRSGSLESVAGALGVTVGRASELLAEMERASLTTASAGAVSLTADGRTYALRVIRIHRLWERYLAEETSVAPAKWHGEAEWREHTTSEEEAGELAARMGYPRFDPHGDPIPTAEGDIAPRRGTPLTDLEIGAFAEIVHLEDEPAEIFAQLMAEKLHPGMHVRVIEASADRIRFEGRVTYDGITEEHVLAPILAANVSVVPIERDQAVEQANPRLSELSLGGRGTVSGFSPFCRGAERRRLLDLGLIPGTEVRAEIRSPGGDPTGYRIRGALIALRHDQAEHIEIEGRDHTASKREEVSA